MRIKRNSAFERQIKNKRYVSGVTIAELPASLSIMFIGFFFPILCLVLMTLRYGLFWEAVREAADAGCQAQTYITASSTNTNANNNTATPASSVGAVELAQTTAVNVASFFPGLTVDAVNSYIIVTPLASTGYNTAGGSTVYGPNTPLNSAPDPTLNLYQLRVEAAGRMQPIMTLPSAIFGNIPGLTGPLPVMMSMVRVFENPPGLYIYSPGNSNSGTGIATTGGSTTSTSGSGSGSGTTGTGSAGGGPATAAGTGSGSGSGSSNSNSGNGNITSGTGTLSSNNGSTNSGTGASSSSNGSTNSGTNSGIAPPTSSNGSTNSGTNSGIAPPTSSNGSTNSGTFNSAPGNGSTTNSGPSINSAPIGR